MTKTLARNQGEPKIEEVAKRLHRISLPLSFDPRKVNVYLEIGEDGTATLFDAGTNDEPCRKALFSALERLGVEPQAVTDVVVTHAHVDHYGLAGIMASDAGTRVLMHHSETLILERHWNVGWWIPAYAEYMRRHGVDAGLAQRLADLEDWRYTLAPLAGFFAIDDGERLESASGRIWQVIHTPGHTSGHICLWNEDEQILIGGDHVLDVYSPHLRHVPGELTDPLSSYLAGLDRIEALAPRIILAGHGRPIEEVGSALAKLRAGHEETLEVVRRAISAPASAAEVTRRMYGDELPDFHLRLALPQTMVYLRHLEMRGEATNHLQGGVVHYLANPSAGGRESGRSWVVLKEAYDHE